MLNSNYLIINRRAGKFTEMKIAGKTAVFLGENGRPVDYGVIALDSTVYTALFCDEVRNVTLVTDRAGVRNVVTILWYTDEGYLDGLSRLRSALPIHFSVQNTRINRYADAIAEKLELGVRLRVTDAVDETDMVKCPECGMLNPAGSEYCLDCGAEIERI